MTDTAPLDALEPALYLIGDDVDARYDVDWSGANARRPDVVLRPRTTEDVAAMLKLCHRAEQPVVVQGGRTGISGGATPQAGEWALSLERLNRIERIDPDGMTITVGAGVPLETIQNAASDVGLSFPLDLGARGSCLAGGIVSTNAGGNSVIRYGMTRALVLGLVVVLADGTVVPAHNTLLKNNAGFDLKQLFIGAEGTLGVVTEVTFRLFPDKPGRQTALCALPTFATVAALLKTLLRELDGLSAFELMWPDYFHDALTATGTNDPFDKRHDYYVLIENEGGGDAASERFIETLYRAMQAGVVADAAISQSAGETNAFWRIRDAIGELMQAWQPAFNFDIGIPLVSIDKFKQAVEAAFAQRFANCRSWFFGHVADGNVHIFVTTGSTDDAAAVDEIVYREAAKFDGSITAEHGVGTLKRNWLHCSRSTAEIALMRTLKETLDPKRILNRDRVI
ncbi:MAG: FAD-binding oxidoreductase [Pseudomonadota bacterium]